MRLILRTKIFIFILYSSYAFGQETSCLEGAYTQLEINECAGISYVKADDELNRVYKEIQSIYADDPVFLEALSKAQLAWIALRDADSNLYFPEPDKQLQYGSVYSMCSSSVEKQLTLSRIAFLKQWIKGAEEGDVCSGSMRLSQ